MPYKKKSPIEYAHYWFQRFDSVLDEEPQLLGNFDVQFGFKMKQEAIVFRRAAKRFLESFELFPNYAPKQAKNLRLCRIQLRVMESFPGSDEWGVRAHVCSVVPLKRIAAEALAKISTKN